MFPDSHGLALVGTHPTSNRREMLIRDGEQFKTDSTAQTVLTPRHVQGRAMAVDRAALELGPSLTLLPISSTPELLTLAAYVSKDGLVGHHWKKRPIGLANFICPSTGEFQGQKGGVGG